MVTSSPEATLLVCRLCGHQGADVREHDYTYCKYPECSDTNACSRRQVEQRDGKITDEMLSSANDIVSLASSLGLGDGFLKLSEKERVTFLLLAMARSGFGICRGCGLLRYLVYHHWYTQAPVLGEDKRQGRTGIVRYRHICSACNNELNRWKMEASGIVCPPVPEGKRDYDISHVLPDWSVQLRYLHSIKSKRDRRLVGEVPHGQEDDAGRR